MNQYYRRHHTRDDLDDTPFFEKIRRNKKRHTLFHDPRSRDHQRLESKDFRCCQCHYWVSSDPLISGVKHRNHCPWCLHSKHVDAVKAGDRLSACHGTMRPVGLTVKNSPNKYGRPESGELMLIHQCLGCGKLSINRIAADDDIEQLVETFYLSNNLDEYLLRQIKDEGIKLLEPERFNVMLATLYGSDESAPEWVKVNRVDATRQ